MTRESDLLPDWFVGGAGKRRLLSALTNHDSQLWKSDPPWTARDLARAAGLHEKGAVGRHLAVLEQAGLLRSVSARWAPGTSVLEEPLRAFLSALEDLPARSLPRSRGGDSDI